MVTAMVRVAFKERKTQARNTLQSHLFLETSNDADQIPGRSLVLIHYGTTLDAVDPLREGRENQFINVDDDVGFVGK